MEERPTVQRVTANILNKQSRRADRGGPPAWGLGEVLTTPQRKNVSYYEMLIEKKTCVCGDEHSVSIKCGGIY